MPTTPWKYIIHKSDDARTRRRKRRQLRGYRAKKRLLRFVMRLTGSPIPASAWAESCPYCKGYFEYQKCTCSMRVKFRRMARRVLS